MLCGEPYDVDEDESRTMWKWTYCSSSCWSSSNRAMLCLAIGDKLAQLLAPHELAVLREGIEEEHHYLDMVLEGMRLPKDG